MKKGLDEKDIQILEILQENCRISYSEISKKLGISEAAIHNRVKRLIRDGYIKKFQAIIDASKVGKSFTAFVAIKADPRHYDELLLKLAEIPEVQEVHDVTGDYYCFLKLRVDSRDSLLKILDMIGKLNGVLATETRVVLRTIKESPSVKLS